MVKPAYYNAGSAAIILILIFLGIGVYLWCRVRRSRVKLPETKVPDEAIPLTSHHNGQVDDEEEAESYLAKRSTNAKGKGKAKAVETEYAGEEGEPMFSVGDSDDEETRRT